MGFFGSSSSHANGKRPPRSMPTVAPRESTILYTGGALSVTLQRAKSQYLEEQGPTRLHWAKDQRLGLTFYELPGGGVAVKDVEAVGSEISVGQELIGVGYTPVAGMDLPSVVQLLQQAASPCALDFTPPPSPIVVSDVQWPATQLGVQRGMVLRAVDGGSMIGATLADVSAAIQRASESAPVRLRFSPYEHVIHRRPRASSNDERAPTSAKSHSTLRNTLCLGAVVAAITL